MQIGDRLTYTTRYGTRTYEVFSKTQISEWDNLPLSWSSENLLTLITCVADVPELRYCVIAREIR
jgi:sortase A